MEAKSENCTVKRARLDLSREAVLVERCDDSGAKCPISDECVNIFKVHVQNKRGEVSYFAVPEAFLKKIYQLKVDVTLHDPEMDLLHTIVYYFSNIFFTK